MNGVNKQMKDIFGKEVGELPRLVGKDNMDDVTFTVVLGKDSFHSKILSPKGEDLGGISKFTIVGDADSLIFPKLTLECNFVKVVQANEA